MKAESITPLCKGYELITADIEQFKRDFAVYVIMQENRAFSRDYKRMVSPLDGAGEVAKFIMKDGYRIGGAILAGNTIAAFYLYPAFTAMEQELLLSLTSLIKEQGYDESFVQVSLLGHVPLLEEIGYKTLHSDRCMIRSTERFPEKIPEGFSVSIPKSEDAREIGMLLYDDGSSEPRFPSPDAALGQSEQFFRMVDGKYMCLEASSLVRNTETSLLAGACLVAIHEDLPIIYEIAVKPMFRRRGLAQAMLERAVSVMYESYPMIKLYVAESNTAKELYVKMHFTSIGPNRVMRLAFK